MKAYVKVYHWNKNGTISSIRLRKQGNTTTRNILQKE